MKTDEIISAESRFLAYFSHDIRMPVTGIIGMADIALENISNREKLEDCLIKIKNSSGYLLSIANNVLDMIQYSNGCMKKINKPFDIEEFIRGCASIFAGLLYNRDINFITYFPGLPVTRVCGDELHLKQILVNLFENSVKYTHNGGEIRFEVEEVRYDNNTVTYCFIISDTVEAIKPEIIENADKWNRFELFGYMNSKPNTRFSDMFDEWQVKDRVSLSDIVAIGIPMQQLAELMEDIQEGQEKIKKIIEIALALGLDIVDSSLPNFVEEYEKEKSKNFNKVYQIQLEKILGSEVHE